MLFRKRRQPALRTIWLLSGAVALCPLSTATPQSIAQLTEAICSGCSLTTARVATLRTPGDSTFYFPYNATTSRNERGQFFVSPLDNLGSFAIFGADGRFLKTAGRVGEGPGEYRLPQWTRFTRGDTTIILDIALRRITILSPDGIYLNSIRAPGYFRDILPLGGGRYVSNGTVGTPESVGHPLHITNAVGTIVVSFGNDGPVRPGNSTDILRRMAVTANSIWSAPTNAYNIDEWSLTGEKTRGFIRTVDWFRSYRDPQPGRFDERPPDPAIRGIQVDAEGRMYVFIAVADRNWELPPRTRPASGAMPPADSNRAGRMGLPGDMGFIYQERFYDTLIEVIDLRLGQVIFSRRFDEALVPMPTPGWVYRYRDDQDFLAIEVFTLSFHNPTQEDP